MFLSFKLHYRPMVDSSSRQTKAEAFTYYDERTDTKEVKTRIGEFGDYARLVCARKPPQKSLSQLMTGVPDVRTAAREHFYLLSCCLRALRMALISSVVI